MKLVLFVLSVGVLAAVEQPKTNCKLTEYDNAKPSLAGLQLTDAEKKKITKLSQSGKKIEAIKIMRRCSDMSLKEQKIIVDKLHTERY